MGLVQDFYQQVDVSAATSFTKVDFGDVLDSQSIYNGSGISVDVSFDGTTKHAVLGTSGPTQALEWANHARGAVWLRRTSGSGGGPLNVDVYGSRGLTR